MDAKITLPEYKIDSHADKVRLGLAERETVVIKNCLFGTADKDSGDLIIYRNINEVVTRLAIFPRGNWLRVEAIEV